MRGQVWTPVDIPNSLMGSQTAVLVRLCEGLLVASAGEGAKKAVLARKLGVSRETVHRYLRAAKPSVVQQEKEEMA